MPGLLAELHITVRTQDVPELTGLPETLDSSYLGFWLSASVREGMWLLAILIIHFPIKASNLYLSVLLSVVGRLLVQRPPWTAAPQISLYPLVTQKIMNT